jgi:hypothetical protein
MSPGLECLPARSVGRAEPGQPWSSIGVFGITARHQIVRVGLALVIAGTTGTIGTLIHGFPLGIAIACWGVTGIGMGIAYNTDSVLAIQAQSEHSAATVTSSMQLTDSLGQVLGTGMGGAMLALASWTKLGTSAGIGITFGLTIAVASSGMLLAPRISIPAKEHFQTSVETRDT